MCMKIAVKTLGALLHKIKTHWRTGGRGLVLAMLRGAARIFPQFTKQKWAHTSSFSCHRFLAKCSFSLGEINAVSALEKLKLRKLMINSMGREKLVIKTSQSGWEQAVLRISR